MVAQAVVRARAELIAGELQRFVDIVSRQLRPRRVILFGSAARDEISEWTDLDLVVVAETELPFYERSRLILNAVRPKVGMDVIVYTPSEWEEMRSTRPFIKREVIEKGRVVYERGN